MIKKQITTNLLVTSLIFSNVSIVEAFDNNTESTESIVEDVVNEPNDTITDNDLNSDLPPIGDIEQPDVDSIDPDNSSPTNPDVSEGEGEQDNPEEDDNTEAESIIPIKDLNLVRALNTILNKEDLNSPILQSEADSVLELDLSDRSISDLSGIEYFHNLEKIYLSNNDIKDVSPIANLKYLETIDLSNNKVFDITPLESSSARKINIANQEILLNLLTIDNDSVSLKSPLICFSSLKIEMNDISHNGILEEEIIKWSNLEKGAYNLETTFKGVNEKIEFSGKIIQPICNKSSDIEDISIDVSYSTEEWTNQDVSIKFKVKTSNVDSIEKIILPNGNTSSKNEGEFTASKNGSYTLSVLLKNGETISKEIKVSNIDKEKPSFKVLDKKVNGRKVHAKISINDSLSGLNYVLLPNGEKTSDGIVELTYSIGESIELTAYDKAGNVETIKLKEDMIQEKPKINASNKSITIGSKFNPLEGVTATDYMGNNITNKIVVTENSVDVNSLGEYNVTYKVEDAFGNTSFKTIYVEVRDSKEEVLSNSDNTQISNMIEKDTSQNKNSNKDAKQSNSSYLFLIAGAIASGFAFLFRSGKDSF